MAAEPIPDGEALPSPNPIRPRTDRSRPSHSCDNHGMFGVNRRGGLLLAALLLLPGCVETKAWFALGMFCSPICYLLSLAVLVALARCWAFSPPVARLRWPVLAAPLLVLTVLAMSLYSVLGDAESDKLRTLIAEQSWFLVVMLSGTSLMGLSGLLWRIWFEFDRESSVEGGAILAATLFYAPGALLSPNLIGSGHNISGAVVLFVLVTLYGSGLGFLAMAGLWGEVLVRRFLLR